MTPSLREELVKRGVQITEPEKKTGKECAEAYETWKGEKAATVSKHSGQDGLRFSTSEIDDFISRAKSVAEQMPETIEYNKENWDKVFPDGKVMTPIGEIKIGEHQFVKTEKNKRTAEIALAKATLERPNIVIEEYDKRPDSDRDTVMLFVKTFVKEDCTTYRHYESVTVQQGDVEASISSHYLRENQLREKLKAGKVLYDATSLDASRQTSLENPANTDSGAPSIDKDNTESSEKQGKNAKTTEKGGVVFSTVEQTETGNFKNWFGDWKNDPEHASKIVGKDGRPLVVYHGGGFGQPDDFYDTYTWDNEGAGGWFTPNRDYAKTYTTRYDDNLEDLPPIEVYLNIRNPFEMGNVERLIIEDDKPTPVLHEIAQKPL